MPGIDPEIVQHYIPTDPNIKPIKQRSRRLQPKWNDKIKEEVEKQWAAGFLQVVKYPEWIANVVPVPKKNGKVRMCVDYRDLNKASPKDDFPLPHIDVLVDNVAGNALLSFMDGFSGYNQILVAPEDREKTTFTTEWGTYCYKVMPFGLKNAGATYQRMATTLLHDMIHKEVEVYVDDMIVKSPTRDDHAEYLDRFLERIKKYRLRLNPQKCVFGVTSGKLLGFIVSERGIEVDPDKIRAILEMPPPKTEKEVRSFMGKIQFISRFIARLSSICVPIFKLLKKNQPVKWNNECQIAFDEIKKILLSPPVLQAPRLGKPLLLYLSVEEMAMGAMLAQEDEEGKEFAIYYISKKLSEAETKYELIEKYCLALVWATRRLRHYMLNTKVQIISNVDPVRYLSEKPALMGKLARWLILLSEFHLEYVVKKTVKGRVIAEYLADGPIDDEKAINQEFPDEMLAQVTHEEKVWKMWFDGASNRKGNGAGIVLETPEGGHMPFAYHLDFKATNNVAEYEACTRGLELLLLAGASKAVVYGDSYLVILQSKKECEVRHERLREYQALIEDLVDRFVRIDFKHVSRDENRGADALAMLASSLKGGDSIPIIVKKKSKPSYEEICMIENKEESEPWYTDILRLIRDGVYPNEASEKDRRVLRRLSNGFVLRSDCLFKRTSYGMCLKCVAEKEADSLMKEIHGGECGPHMNGRMLAQKIRRMGYFWITMEHDCTLFVRRCDKCQRFGNLDHVPPSELHGLSAPWPFAVWGIDIIGKIHPKASNGHEFILVAIDYFTKWVEAESFAVLGAKQVSRFFQKNIITRYGVPSEVISDNGTQFMGEFASLMSKYRVKHHKSSPYRPQTNGAVEAANKNLKKILSKMIDEGKSWAEKLPLALWAYRTSVRSSTGMTPYSLVYGTEAVLPAEIRIQSMRLMVGGDVDDPRWEQARHDQLTLLDEKRLKALDSMQIYHKRIARAFNKRVKDRDIRAGDLVLKEMGTAVYDPRGKFRPNWSGPYVVKVVTPYGAVKLMDLDGNEFASMVNLDRLKRYYA
jgi:ribonuclease HI